MFKKISKKRYQELCQKGGVSVGEEIYICGVLYKEIKVNSETYYLKA